MDCKKCLAEFLTVESSREMGVTQISCDECGDFNSYEKPEEDAIEEYLNQE